MKVESTQCKLQLIWNVDLKFCLSNNNKNKYFYKLWKS